MYFKKGFRKFGGMNIPKPVKVGEEYDVQINEMGSRGDGIARIKNFVVFVAGTKQGEKTKIKIKEVKNRFAIGEKVESEKGEEV
ncbi:MAG: TRAM domain-containing protein [Candidatus Aenigmatarchaeota archaeon]